MTSTDALRAHISTLRRLLRAAEDLDHAQTNSNYTKDDIEARQRTYDLLRLRAHEECLALWES